MTNLYKKKASESLIEKHENAKFTEKPTTSEKLNSGLPFRKSNYLFMIIGVLTILSGYFIMTLDKEPFGFGFLGITLGPIVLLIGFLIELFAILKK